MIYYLAGGFTPSEKYIKNISQLGLLFPIYGKIRNVPNHQPVMHIAQLQGHQQPLLWALSLRQHFGLVMTALQP